MSFLSFPRSVSKHSEVKGFACKSRGEILHVVKKPYNPWKLSATIDDLCVVFNFAGYHSIWLELLLMNYIFDLFDRYEGYVWRRRPNRQG